MNLNNCVAVSIGFGLLVSAVACGGMPDAPEMNGAATTSDDVPLTGTPAVTEETDLLGEEAHVAAPSGEAALADIASNTVRWSGRFVALGVANPSPVLATGQVKLQPGASASFSMALNLDPASGLSTPARLGVRVSWKWFADDFAERGVAASPFCETRTPSVWTTCTWTFTAPAAGDYPSATGAYRIAIQDRTDPDPGRNYSWAASMTKSIETITY